MGSLLTVKLKAIYNLFKSNVKNPAFFFNNVKKPVLMRSSSLKHSLRVIIENNAEEVERYEKTKTESSPEGDLTVEPTTISVSLHNPKEPADIRSHSIKIPYGHTTTVYIWPQIRKIDESGKKLTETERNCRLDEDTGELSIYNVYTRAACLFECKMKYSMGRCGCVPWNYPHTIMEQVGYIIHSFI